MVLADALLDPQPSMVGASGKRNRARGVRVVYTAPVALVHCAAPSTDDSRDSHKTESPFFHPNYVMHPVGWRVSSFLIRRARKNLQASFTGEKYHSAARGSRAA